MPNARRPHRPDPTKPATGAPAVPVDAMADLPLPHERDEGAGAMTGDGGPGPTDPVIEQAHRDIQRGMVDTDMRATPGLDAERRERMVPTPPPAGRKRRGAR